DDEHDDRDPVAGGHTQRVQGGRPPGRAPAAVDHRGGEVVTHPDAARQQRHHHRHESTDPTDHPALVDASTASALGVEDLIGTLLHRRDEAERRHHDEDDDVRDARLPHRGDEVIDRGGEEQQRRHQHHRHDPQPQTHPVGETADGERQDAVREGEEDDAARRIRCRLRPEAVRREDRDDDHDHRQGRESPQHPSDADPRPHGQTDRERGEGEVELPASEEEGHDEDDREAEQLRTDVQPVQQRIARLILNAHR
ncbi:hypothetical protein ABE10_00615, partial [Bacillus toyonensis]|nr:hypothetical protein [Bacillus toyonensis]